MPKKLHHAHEWGTPPWRIGFRPTKRPIPAHADFIVVGAGFSGLSAAAWLRKLAPTKSVLVLERAAIGDSASGRTGGMALAETAAGKLPGLGDVLRSYRQILRMLKIDAELSLPGAFELARKSGPKLFRSPIHWNDSGDLHAVRKVPGGTVHPGKVAAGLARAAQRAGAHIIEHAEVLALKPVGRRQSKPSSKRREVSNPASQAEVELKLRLHHHGKSTTKTITATRVLLATNAQSLNLPELSSITHPKLTLAIATAPLTRAQIKSLGLASRNPFYTVDLPYLWGRLTKNNSAIFGAGLVDPPQSHSGHDTHNLHRINIRKAPAAERLAWLEDRVRNLHPALKNIRITHRWGGPILLTEAAKPIFRQHPRHPQVTILAGFNGHGVALSVYLGHWAAQHLATNHPLPNWSA
jgi:glycine/D-amino acid oxidase-like deaminating enzyme